MYCQKCSYSLNGLDRNRCPECGRLFDSADPNTFRRKPYRVSPFWKRTIVAMVMLTIYLGAYFGLVKIGTKPISNHFQYIALGPEYRAYPEIAAIVFAPAHRVDRLARFNAWNKPAWRPTGWGRGPRLIASQYQKQMTRSRVHFVVSNDSIKVWTRGLGLPIKINEHPMVTMQYRATNTDTKRKWYVLWIGDQTGMRGGIVFRSSDIICDGTIREIHADLRVIKPIGALNTLALGVSNGSKGHATFELLGLTFESSQVATGD